MNKLINRISPETSENRILHAGFSIILMSEEITQTLSGLSSDMIIFILSGSITIYSTKEEKKTIGEQYMIFLRSFENYTYDITLGSKIIIFFFDSLTMRLIAENYIKAKTVTDLAQMIGYGVNSFRMKFKKVFGIPAYEWLMQEKSKRLLVAIANSEDDFKNIIDEFDFSSHSHFYKFCKARFGYSPTELRKKLKSL